MLPVAESFSLGDDAVDPGFELAWDSEVVKRRANHDDVGHQKFFQQGRRFDAAKPGEREVVDRVGRQVAVADVQVRVIRAQLLDDCSGNGAVTEASPWMLESR